MIRPENQRCRVRIRGNDGGYHDCRRPKDHAGPHGNPVYGDFKEGSPVVKKRIGAAAAVNYETVGVIDDKGKVQRTD